MGRTQACGAAEALAKLSRAKRFLEAADLVKDEPDPDFMSVAAALAVLAGLLPLMPRVQGPRSAVARSESRLGRAGPHNVQSEPQPSFDTHRERSSGAWLLPCRSCATHVCSNSADVDLLVDALRSLAGVAETGPGSHEVPQMFISSNVGISGI